ncbi:SRPBCC family protein [Dactylosporangium sp. CS-033363]|uniref:SRPBCC family protein n=1 Tax=Dactylosporangium sp. CS-033363 TaxID=3239935 RepID=UPI003D8AC45F
MTDIVATVRIEAPPHVVFPYFTDPALIVAWIGERADLDPHPGGRFFLDFGTVAASGEYRVIDPPHRVVFSWGIPGSGDLPPGASTVEVVLTADGPATVVVLTHHGLSASHLDGHRTGWHDQLGRLQTVSAVRA